MKKSKIIVLCLALFLLCSIAVLSVHAELTETGKQLQRYDLNCDGKASIADVAGLLDCIAGNCTHQRVNNICVLEKGRSNDVGREGNVSIADVALVLDYLANNCGHSETPMKDVLPTCKTTGLTGGTYCALCNKVLSTQGEVPTIGHDYQSGKCTMCGEEEYKSTLEVTSVSADKTFLATNEQVTFSAVTNKDSSQLTLSATLYLNGTKVDTVSGTGNVKYKPVSAGRYDAEVSVTDDGVTFFTYFLKSCFDVKESWALTQVSANTSNATLGQALTFAPKVSGNSADLTYIATVYRNGLEYYSAEFSENFDFYPNVAGTYYTVIEARDSFGGNVVINSHNSTSTDALEILSPASDGTYVQNDLFIQWTKPNSAVRYVLSLDYHCGASYHSVLANVEFDGSQSSYTISKAMLHPGCKHRLKVYAYDTAGKKSTETIYFRIEGDQAIYVLDAPVITNSYFFDNKDDVKTYPTYGDLTITWTKIPAAAYYKIFVESEYVDVDDPVLENSNNLKTNSFTIPIEKLTSGCEYSVEVIACCADGHGKRSETMYFKAPYANGTLEGPEITSHSFSQDESAPTTVVEQALTITWKPVTAAVTYSVYLYEVGHSGYDVKFVDLTSTSVTIPYEYINAWGSTCDYRLRLLAKDANGFSEESEYFIRVTQKELESPVIVSPTLATDDEGFLPSFEDDFTITWKPVKGAVSYKVRVWECFDGDLFELFSGDNLTDTSFDIPLEELYFGEVCFLFACRFFHCPVKVFLCHEVRKADD